MIATLLALALQRGDVVTLNDRRVFEGTVNKDDFGEVHVKPKTGAVQKLKAEDVRLVEYATAPPGFNNALQLIEQGRYKEALEQIRGAEEALKTIKEEMSKRPTARKYPDAVPADDKWWIPYSAYYRAVCMRMTRNYIEAAENYDLILNSHKDFRLVREAYLGAMRAAIDRSDPDKAKAAALLAAASADKARLGDRLLKELELAQIELLVRIEDYAGAEAAYKRLAESPDEEVAVQGVRGVLLCKQKAGASDIPTYCANLIATKTSGKIKMVAAASLGSTLLDKGDHRAAVAQFVEAIVLHYPGRGSGLEGEHEEALFNLAACYEGMAKGAAGKAAKTYWTMAAQTYAEILAAYSSSDRAEDAARKKSEAEAQAAAAGE